MNTKPRIIDCFTFYNELDVLYYRLNLLYEHVDFFVLVEARQTHMGNPKRLYYKENADLYSRFANKIVHIIVDLPIPAEKLSVEKGEQWINEKFQRSSIMRGIEEINSKCQLKSTDLCIISDLDEIINPNLLQNINQIPPYSGYALAQKMYYYNLNFLHKEIWTLAKMVTIEEIINLDYNPDAVRHRQYPIIQNAGWHLSYFGDVKHIKNKIQQFTHQEFNTANITDDAVLEKNITNGVDIYGRANVEIQRVDESDLPPLATTYLKNYIGSYTNRVFNKPIIVKLQITMCENIKSILKIIFFQLRNSGLYKFIEKIYVFGDCDAAIIFASDIDGKVIYTNVENIQMSDSYILYLNTDDGFEKIHELFYNF